MAKYMTDTEKKYVESAKLEKIISDGLNSGKFGHDAVEILSEIYALESADVAPVRHARWEPISLDDQDEGIFRCTDCKREQYFGSWDTSYYDNDYCAHCGAKMDLED